MAHVLPMKIPISNFFVSEISSALRATLFREVADEWEPGTLSQLFKIVTTTRGVMNYDQKVEIGNK